MASLDKQYAVDAEVLIHKVNSGGVIIGTPYNDPLNITGILDEVLTLEIDLTHPTVDKAIPISDLTVKFVYLKSCETTAGNPDPVTVKFVAGDTGFPVTSAIMEATPADILLSTIDKDLRVQVWVGGKD